MLNPKKGIPLKSRLIKLKIHRNTFYSTDLMDWVKKNRIFPSQFSNKSHYLDFGQLLLRIGKIKSTKKKGFIKHISSKQRIFEDKQLVFRFAKSSKDGVEHFVERYNEIQKMIYFAQHKDKLAQFYEDFKKNVDIKERTEESQVYQQCFIASHAVTYIFQYLKLSKRKMVILFCDILVNLGIFKPLKEQTLFEDDFSMHRIAYDENEIDSFLGDVTNLLQIVLKRSCVKKEKTLIEKAVVDESNTSMRKVRSNIDISLILEDQDEVLSIPSLSPMIRRASSPINLKVETISEKRLSFQLENDITSYMMYSKRNSLPNDFQFLSDRVKFLKKKVVSPKTPISGRHSPISNQKRPSSPGTSVLQKVFQPQKITKVPSQELKKKTSKRNLTQIELDKGIDDILMEGKLNQMVNQKWASFYFVVKVGGIFKKKSKESSDILQLILMGSKSTVVPLDITGKRYCISLFSGAQTLFLEAANEEQQQNWISSIQASIDESIKRNKNALDLIVEAGIALDDKFKISEVNTKAEKLFGYPQNELIGKYFYIIFPIELYQCYKNLFESKKEVTTTIVAFNFKHYTKIPIGIKFRKLPNKLFGTSSYLAEFYKLPLNIPDTVTIPQNLPEELREFYNTLYKGLNQNIKLLDEKLEQTQRIGKILQEHIYDLEKELEKQEVLLKAFDIEFQLSEDKSNLNQIYDQLNDPNSNFYLFCKFNGYQSYVSFWTEAERYSKLTDQENIVNEAQLIFDKYLSLNCQHPIINDQDLVDFIKEKLNTGNQKIFKSVQKDILLKLDEHMYNKFLSTKKDNKTMFEKLGIIDSDDDEFFQ